MNFIRDGFIVMVCGGAIWLMIFSAMIGHEISWANDKPIIKSAALIGLAFVVIGYIITLMR